MENLAEIVRSFPEKRIVVIGDVMLDRYISGKLSESKEAPVHVLKVENGFYAPGGAANVASNIASLGGKVSLFGFVGDDDNSRILKKLLDENNIEYYFDRNSQTILKLRPMSGNSQLMRIDFEDCSKTRFSRKTKQAMKERLESSDVVLISDYNKGAITEGLMNFLYEYKRKMIVDPKPKNKSLYHRALLITPNKEEALEMSGKKSIDDAGRYLRGKLNSDILITLGADGMRLFSQTERDIPTYARKVVNFIGAGDSAISGVALSIAAGASLHEAAVIGNHAAGIAVGEEGTYQVKLDELERKISGESLKRKNLEELCRIAEDARRRKRKIVFTSGCYDILHPGHTKFLGSAKSYGDILVLALNSDKSPFFKTKTGDIPRPVLKEKERIDVLSSLEQVDFIITFDEDSPENLIEALKPDVKVKGGSYIQGRVAKEDSIVESYGGSCVYIPLVGDFSTTKLIDKIRNGS